MNREEWEQYQSDPMPNDPVIKGSEFDPPSPEVGMRLLCSGYHRNSVICVRVWLDYRGWIGLQHDDRDIVWREWWSTLSLYPDKRAYPEETDLHFARLMRERHEYPLRFTAWPT